MNKLFMHVRKMYTNQAHYFGNGPKYDIEHIKKLENSPLEGKTMIFLGSSVTYGSASNGVSFVDYIQKRNSVTTVKEAVSGTTLIDNGDSSYIKRMLHNIDRKIKADAFVCQLSTNDASQNFPLGEISDSEKLEDFDTSTITGAMEYIIVYARETFKCPVVFYTGTYYDSKNYNAMVVRLLELQEKYDIGVINMWNDDKMQKKFKKKYMADSIHPSKAGYIRWWTPVMEKYLYYYLSE